MLFQKMFMSGLFVFHNHSPNQGAFYYFLTRGFLFGCQHIKKRQKPHNLKLNHSFLDVQWVVMLLQQL